MAAVRMVVEKVLMKEGYRSLEVDLERINIFDTISSNFAWFLLKRIFSKFRNEGRLGSLYALGSSHGQI